MPMSTKGSLNTEYLDCKMYMTFLIGANTQVMDRRAKIGKDGKPFC